MDNPSRLPALTQIRNGAANALVAIGTAIAPTKKPDSLGEVVSAFESETYAVLVRTSPRRLDTVFLTTIGMISIGIIMMWVLQLDIVINGNGQVVPTAGAIYVQPLNQAVVREIKVRVGQVVHKGDVLATLDPTFVDAAYEQASEKVQSDTAQVARDEAEIADKPYAPAGVNLYEKMQLALYQQTISNYQQTVASYDSQIANAVATVKQLQGDITQYSKRLALASEHENMDKTLEQKGWGSALLTLSSTDTAEEMRRDLSDSRNQLVANEATVQNVTAQKAAYIQKFHSDASSDLVSTRNDLDQQTANLKSDTELKAMSSITAPQDAIVVQIAKASPSSVTGPTNLTTTQEALFTLTPLGKNVEVVIDVATMDAGFLKPGQPVTIKLDAFQFMRYGVVMGTLKTVTAASFQINQNTMQPVQPYVEARVAIKDYRLYNVPSNFQLIPGMTLTGEVLVGRRSILSYFVEGAMRTVDESMREP